MSRKTRGSVSSTAPAPIAKSPLVDGLLVTFVRMLVSKGAAPDALAKRFAQICGEMAASAPSSDRDVSRYLVDLTDVLARWFNDPEFQNERGRLALPLKGPGPSLTKLILRVFPEDQIAAVVDSLLRSQSVRREGNVYHAVARYVSFAEEPTHAQVHALDSVSSLLTTAQWNIDCANPTDRLLERSATNTSIPVRELANVRERFKLEMGAILTRLDIYLTEVAVPPGSEPTVFVRLGAYEAIEPIESTTGATAPALKPARRARRRGARA